MTELPSRNPQRILGQTRADTKGHLLSTYREKPPQPKPREPSPETDDPPIDTSDEEFSLPSDSDLEGVPGRKRKRKEEGFSSVKTDPDIMGESIDRADIPSTKWTKRDGSVQASSQLVEDEPWGAFSSSQPQKQYNKSRGPMKSSNIHGKSVDSGNKKSTGKATSTSMQQARKSHAYKNLDTAVAPKQRDKLKSIQESNKSQTSLGGGGRAESEDSTKKNLPKFKQPAILGTRSSVRLRSEESFKAPPEMSPTRKKSKGAKTAEFIAPPALEKSGLGTQPTFKNPHRHISKTPPPPAETFKLPELPTSSQILDDPLSPTSSLTTPLFSPNLSTSSKSLSFSNSSAPTNPKSTPSEQSESAICPVCATPVPSSLLTDFILIHSTCPADSRLTMRQQSLFCRTHKTETAHDTWRARGYPEIDWGELPARLENHQDVVSDIIKGQESFYRNVFEEKVRKGTGRTLVQSLMDMGEEAGSETGYYGSRGAKVMMDHIITTFSRSLRRLAQTDKLIVSGGGTPSYVQAVLVPELAVSLIMEDMDLDKEGARRVLSESADLGELVNEEEDEVVIREGEGEWNEEER
ncbi:MAG: hypothetical protein MMC33_002813 [Icmadophila ericetorum]|nr:hypothetical protein [Icmadophila ericetorum]